MKNDDIFHFITKNSNIDIFPLNLPFVAFFAFLSIYM